MIKIAFTLMVFNDDYVLRECLESVLPFGQVVAAEGPVAYWRGKGFKTSTDQTNQILDEYGIPTVRSQFGWQEKDDMAVSAGGLVRADTEFVWQLDADEIWAAEDIRRVVEILAAGQVDSMSFHAHSFYGGFERVMGGFEEQYETHRIQRWYPGARWATHRPPTVLAPDGRPWREHRHVDAEQLGIRFFHYSYVFPLQMARKAAYYRDRDPGGTIPDYFERVYLPWVTGGDLSRQRVEDAYDGVHNWLPQRRGPCRTRLANRPHPVPIRAAMPRLRERFERELRTVLGYEKADQLVRSGELAP